ncbi:MAG: hypothetical protein C0501_21370 [Isosphaera sp.]|nr:hypothetical protein [Isosphaera sp.]
MSQLRDPGPRPAPRRTIRILQISDLGVGAAHTKRLAADAVSRLKGRIPGPLDYIAVCGNVTSDRSAAAFAAAREVIRHLVAKYLPNRRSEDAPDRANRLLVVPGRIDILDNDWTAFRAFYRDLYQDVMGVTDDRSAEWGDDPANPRAWVRDLRDLTAVGIPAWWSVDPNDPAGRQDRADRFRDALMEACDRLVRAEYSRYTPSLLISAASPLFCPFGRGRMARNEIGEQVQRLAPDLHLFGQSPVVCLPAEPFVFPHTALSTGPVCGTMQSDWPDRANLVEFWPPPSADRPRQVYLRISRYERNGQWQHDQLTDGDWDTRFPPERHCGPPTTTPDTVITHTDLYAEFRRHIDHGCRILRMECLPGTGIRHALRQLAARGTVHQLLGDWRVFVAYTAVELNTALTGVERERDLLGEGRVVNPELDQLPGLARARRELREADRRFVANNAPADVVLLVMWDEGPEEDLPRSRQWTEQLRQDIAEFIDTDPNDPGRPPRVFLYLRRASPGRAAPLPLPEGVRICPINMVPYQPLAGDAVPPPADLAQFLATAPIDWPSLGAVAGGYIGLATGFIRQAQRALAESPGSRPITGVAQAMLHHPTEALRDEWHEFRGILEALTPPVTPPDDPAEVYRWRRPGAMTYFMAFVRRRLNRLLGPNPVSGADWPRVEFHPDELRPILPSYMAAGELGDLLQRLMDFDIIRPLGDASCRYRVVMLAPFVHARQRFPVFVSFSKSAGHDRWLNLLLPQLQDAWGNSTHQAEGFLDLWTYVNEQSGSTDHVHQIWQNELGLRNNLMVLFDNLKQFQHHAHGCQDEVREWWRVWEPSVAAGVASFSHIQVGTGPSLLQVYSHGRVRLQAGPEETRVPQVAQSIIERLRPDVDR